jgi:hemerythrin
MSLMTWTKESYGTGVSLHDGEHQQLFELVNGLDDAVQRRDRASTGARLDTLIAFVAKHFASEEASMARVGFAGAASHRAEHAKLVETCIALQKSFHAGEAEVTADTLAFVKSWLDQHIPHIDRAYGPAITARS